MYIRQSSRTYKGKTYINYVLVESILTPKGPRQKIICSLGDLRPRPHAEWLALAHKLSSALSGQADLLDTPAPDSEWQDLLPTVQSAAPPSLPADAAHPTAANSDLLAVHVDQVRTEESREAGPVHAGYQFWQRLGLDAILAQAGLSERVRQLTCAMTLNRLIHPASELATPDWIRSTALPDILQVDFQLLAEDALYRNLDRLHAQRVAIETALAERERTLFGLDQTLFLYDVTSTYFQGGRGTARVMAEQITEEKRPGDSPSPRETTVGGLGEATKTGGEGQRQRHPAGRSGGVHRSAEGAIFARRAVLPYGVRQPDEGVPLQLG